MSDVFTIVSIIVIVCSLCWSAGVLIYALIKKIKLKKEQKRTEKEALDDVNSSMD